MVLADRLWGRSKEALADVSFSVAPGECVAVLGANGAGKSTLLLAAAGVLPLHRGEITLEGLVYGPGAAVQKRIRERIGIALQFPERGFFLPRVAEEVSYVAVGLGIAHPADRDALARAALRRVGLPEVLADRSPYSLSGGEKRLVALAAAVAHRPRYLLLDEPDAGLDRRASEAVGALLRAHRQEGGAALVATHDLESALAWATRILLLEEGRIAADVPASRLREPDTWTRLGRWLWDRGELGRAHARLCQAGLAVPSPYVEPVQCVDWLKSRLFAERPPGMGGSG